MKLIHLLFFTLLASLAIAQPAERRVRLVEAVDLDTAGKSLRQAINAFEADAEKALPQEWTTLDLTANRSVQLGRHNFMVLAAVYEDEALVVFVGEESPVNATLRRGKETEVGPLKVILVSATPNSSRAQVLLRTRMPSPVLLEQPVITPSPTRIRGVDAPKSIIIESPDERTLQFAESFLRALNEGNSAREAAELAREQVPPVVIEEQTRPQFPGLNTGRGRTYDEFEDDYLPQNAQITLRVVRGESSALKELFSSTEYNSDGRMPDNPRVGGRSGADGGTIEVGQPGDRFQLRLRALEASGKLNVESESFARVPIGGDSYFSFQGPQGMASGYFHVSPRGRERVQVDIDQASGDWGFLGGVSTRAIFRDGQTIPLARSMSSRTTSSRSSTPILGQIPIIGPIFGNSRETSESTSYALFATVVLE